MLNPTCGLSLIEKPAWAVLESSARWDVVVEADVLVKT